MYCMELSINAHYTITIKLLRVVFARAFPCLFIVLSLILFIFWQLLFCQNVFQLLAHQVSLKTMSPGWKGLFETSETKNSMPVLIIFGSYRSIAAF